MAASKLHFKSVPSIPHLNVIEGFKLHSGEVMTLSKIACLPLVAVALFAQTATQIEPKAGTWKTCAISSGKDYRVPPPPDASATRGELEWLHAAVTQNDPHIADQISYWDAGSPAYRWLDLLSARIARRSLARFRRPS